jgi:hypothetical protein
MADNEDNSIWAQCKRKPQWIPFSSKDESSLRKFVRATGGGKGEMDSAFEISNSSRESALSDPIEKRAFNQCDKSTVIFDSTLDTPNGTSDSPNLEKINGREVTKPLNILGFGRIAFPECSTPSLYLRVPWKIKDASGSEIVSTHPQALLYFIENVWKLPRPRLLISITGGAVDFPMDPHKEAVLEQLMDTARRTNAWLVTGGSRAGIMKYVGTPQPSALLHGSQQAMAQHAL